MGIVFCFIPVHNFFITYFLDYRRYWTGNRINSLSYDKKKWEKSSLTRRCAHLNIL
jgi:hypothetical protein